MDSITDMIVVLRYNFIEVPMSTGQATQMSLYGFETRDVDNRRTDRSETYDIKQL